MTDGDTVGRHIPRLRNLGIDTSQESVIYMRRDCPVCRSEGFSAYARVEVSNADRSTIATLHVIDSDILRPGEVSLSAIAIRRLRASDGAVLAVTHALAIESLSHVRGKIYGSRLDDRAFTEIVRDITAGRYSDVHLSSFVTACTGGNLDRNEIRALTQAMIDAGERIDWGQTPIVDKHCVGGLPGNRTTPIIVAIAAAHGLVIPKTSSRAITSPAGTADTMETLAPVSLDLKAMRRVVEREGGCVVWGGSVDLSPADDILIRVERALDLDGEGQLVASVLSKKIAAGATHLILDLPTGPSAKIRSKVVAGSLSEILIDVANRFAIEARALISDGYQPVGQGVGPALEAWDVLATLRNLPGLPLDLQQRSVTIAGALIELAEGRGPGDGERIARSILESGEAWKKFQAICEAQGGLREPSVASYRHEIAADRPGRIVRIDNRLLSRLAKLAGAPQASAAGVRLHKKLNDTVEFGEPIFTIHADSPGELDYALGFAEIHRDIMTVEAPA